MHAQHSRRLDFGHTILHIGTHQLNARVINHHPRAPMLAAALHLIRPKHWIKNLVVFAPLVFAKELFDLPIVLTAVRAFAAFSITASCVYVINDIADVEADRVHPEKRNRPLAAGTITRTGAMGVLGLLAAGLLVACIGLDYRFLILLAVYFGLNLAYSIKLKEVMLLDVFIIAAGFMLRVLGGAYAIDVTVTSWIVLCSLFISLFLGFAKRRAELVHFRDAGTVPPRAVLRIYSVGFLDQMLTIAAAGAVISYALYTVAPRTYETFGTDKLIYTTVFVIYGIFRYLYLIHSGERSENPTNALISDPPILVNGMLWILTCIFLIYRGRGGM